MSLAYRFQLFVLLLFVTPSLPATQETPEATEPQPVSLKELTNPHKAEIQKLKAKSILKVEDLHGDGIWVDPKLARQQGRGFVDAKIWFDKQFLGDGDAYLRRAKEFKGGLRTKLREQMTDTLKTTASISYLEAKPALDQLKKEGLIKNIRKHWVINAVSLKLKPTELSRIKTVPGVKKIFFDPYGKAKSKAKRGKEPFAKGGGAKQFNPDDKLVPWYITALQADKVWRKFNVKGQGVLNIIHDFNFVWNKNITNNVFSNPGEIPGNGIDDDKNGYVDDVHGFNFETRSQHINPNQYIRRGHPRQMAQNGQIMHGHNCAAIICSPGKPGGKASMGIAPESQWAGVIGMSRIEEAVEWAISMKADTYSMSFSLPNLGEFRSHWRKLMEHASFCGIYFASGAGNFGDRRQRSFAPVPVQMRVPEDIPNVVFAAAGIQRNFAKTSFSSKGPVKWDTEHYKQGLVQKPLVCAFNHKVPEIKPTGQIGAVNGNSFAGPMFCGSISLMVSADPDLLPWDLKEIITTTATDVSKPGVDYETGHGLINTYRAVKEVLRRKAVREGKDATPFEGREFGDVYNKGRAMKDSKRQVFRKAWKPLPKPEPKPAVSENPAENGDEKPETGPSEGERDDSTKPIPSEPEEGIENN